MATDFGSEELAGVSESRSLPELDDTEISEAAQSTDPETAGPDRHLFKYCTFDTARIVLETGRLRWSRPGLFNDVFDSQFELRTLDDEETLQPLILEALWASANSPETFEPRNQLGFLHKWGAPAFVAMGREAYFREMGGAVLEGIKRGKAGLPRFFAEIKEHVSRSKILCFSEDPLSRSLWGHYGESGRGVVLEFCSVPVLDSPYSLAQKVAYMEQPPLLHDRQFLVEWMSGQRKLEPHDILQKMSFVKHVDWSWEREWRIISGNGRNPEEPYEDIGFHEMELAAVLLGPRVGPPQIDEMRALLHGKYFLTKLEQLEAGKHFELMRGRELTR